MRTLSYAASAIAASLALLSCSDAGSEQIQSTPNLFGSNGSFQDILDTSFIPKRVYELAKAPAMDSRVAAYKKGMRSEASLGYSGITDDGDVLASWFPNALGDGQANDECGYFAIYSSTYSAPFTHYLTLSQDKALHAITCTVQGDGFFMTDDFIYEALLVCGDKAGALKNGINADSVRIYRDPDWACGGAGGPDPEDIFFDGTASANPHPIAGCRQSAAEAPAAPAGISPSCQADGKTLFRISDLQQVAGLEPPSVQGGCDAAGNCGIILNGQAVSSEEYQAFMAEYQRENARLIAENSRDLDIPCSVKLGSQVYQALLTDEEADALRAAYSDIVVSEELVPVNADCL